MPHIMHIGLFPRDRRAFDLRRKGQPVRISASLLKLLILFLDHPGELITREQIDLLVESVAFVDVTNAINTAVSHPTNISCEPSEKRKITAF